MSNRISQIARTLFDASPVGEKILDYAKRNLPQELSVSERNEVLRLVAQRIQTATATYRARRHDDYVARRYR